MVDAFIVHKKDIESFRSKKEILKKDLPDSNLSVEDILNKRNDCINTLDLLEQEIDGKHDEILQATKNILDRKSKVIVMLESKLTLLSAAKENEWLNDQQRNLNKDILSVETQLEENKKQLFELIKEVNGLNETRHILENKRGKINPDLEIQKLESIQKLLFDDLQKADEAASKFHEEKMRLEELIEINEQQLKNSLSAIKTLNKEIQSYKDDIDKLNERNIEDNLHLRKVNKEIEDIEGQLKNKQQKRLEKINGAQLSKDIAIKEAQKQALSIELAKASTTKEHLRCNITKLKMDLQNEKYRDVEKKYVESIIKSKTYSKASDELVDYHNALDNAIVKYHEIKMEKINQTAKELWQETYSGKDIDCIKITSERKRENKSTVHSYDYGVKMVSDDDERDVKECCSAGQKVLASLVIRLAIAQHCCKNFNVLALDEPTTNLDRNNIENLAISLNKLVSMRSGQINFQLLVITHNETFVELLGNCGSVERYFRVRKKKSYSCIKTEPISHIFDHDDDSDDEKGEDAMML
ncbi:DNA repair protein RAD50.L-like [Clavelina lepadiformis]|uniref:DNA repair protein RAD50.L-like n=1 Tax=Clavelina lepadiformis TaxID=159417 RepID=UPI004043158E